MYGQPVQVQPQYVDNPPYYATNSMQDVNAIKPQPAATTGFRDWPFALLFILNVAAIIVLTIMYGTDALKDDDDSSGSGSSDTIISGKDTKTVVGIAVGMSAISVVLALAFVKLIVAYASFMITFVMWFNVFFAVAIAAYGFLSGIFFLGIIGALLVLLNLCYVWAVRPRIPFAVANLRVAEAAISKHSTTYCVSIIFTIIQIAWVVLWSLAFLGVAEKLKNSSTSTGTLTNGSYCTSSSQCASNSCRLVSGYRECVSSTSAFFTNSAGGYVAYFFLLLSFYWGIQVFKNIAHTTVAGTVATFWYNADSAGATGSSLKRSCTTSLGSICFGSLIVAVIQALRAMVESARGDDNALACLADCILACLQSIMEYINRWAFVYVGIYGYKFTQAGKAVFDLFHQRGFDAIINDDLIGNVLSFAALGVGLICAAIGALLAEYTSIVSFDNSTVVLAVLGFIVGLGVAITPLAVVDSSVATIFVCFAEDPAAFMQSHPDLYQPLVTEWHNLYPEVMVQAGYCAQSCIGISMQPSNGRLFARLGITCLLFLTPCFASQRPEGGSDVPDHDASLRQWKSEVARFLGITALVCMSAIFSGLTLGLMSLDKVALEVIVGAGVEAHTASKDERKNAIAATASCLDLVGFLVSTITIVICGEIVPQALCSRHALTIGSALVPLVRVLLFVLYPAAKPVALVLDYALGVDAGTIFSKREFQKLLEIHVKQQALHPDEGHIVRGAMGYKHKPVSEIMIPLDRIGFSRMPVWGKDKNDVIGVVFIKDLVMIDPKHEVPLRDFAQAFAHTTHRIWLDATLGGVLTVFKKGATHMALVYDVNNAGPGDPFYELKGMITLEDIVEEILQDKIVDETDSDDARL